MPAHLNGSVRSQTRGYMGGESNGVTCGWSDQWCSHYKYLQKISVIIHYLHSRLHLYPSVAARKTWLYGGKDHLLPLFFDLFSTHRYVLRTSVVWISVYGDHIWVHEIQCKCLCVTWWRKCRGEGFITSPPSLSPSPLRFSSIKALRFRGLVCWYREHWQDGSQFLESSLRNHLSRQAGRPVLRWSCLDWLPRCVPSSSFSVSLSHDDSFSFFFHPFLI